MASFCTNVSFFRMLLTAITLSGCGGCGSEMPTRSTDADAVAAEHVFENPVRNIRTLVHDGADGLRPGLKGSVFVNGGKRVVTWGNDQTVRVWETTKGDQLLRLDNEHGVIDVSIHPDSRTIMTSGFSRRATLWDIESGESLRTLNHGQDVFSTEFFPDGKRILTWCQDGTANVTDVLSGERLNSFPLNGMSGIALSRDASWLVACSETGTGKLWNLNDGSSRDITGRSTYSRWFCEDNVRFYTADSGLQAWSVKTGQPEGPKHGDRIAQFELSPDRKLAIGLRLFDETATLFNLESEESPRFLKHRSVVTAMTDFSGDSRKVLTSARDHSALLWSTKDGELLQRFPHGSELFSVLLNHAGTLVVTGGDGSVKFWGAASGKEVAVIELEHSAHGLRFSDDERFLVIWGSGRQAILVELKTVGI